MRTYVWMILVVIASIGGLVGTAFTGSSKYEVDGKRSGYTYAEPETRAMQDDEFENPGFLWVEQGAELWSIVAGQAGMSCESCHQDASASMKKVGATYPIYDEKLGKLINIEQRINQCRTDRMQADAWKWESKALLSMTTYVRHQAHGEPITPNVEGPAKPFFEKGKAFYEERRGQLDMACLHCHGFNNGRMMRANLLTQGHSNGFPTYRLK